MFPTPRFNSQVTERIIAQNSLGFTQAGALRLWSDMARQIDPDILCQKFRTAGFSDIKTEPYLDGALATVTGTKAI